jgi:hypothetical protein
MRLRVQSLSIFHKFQKEDRVAEKNRSAGVTVIAILALIGSALLLAIAGLVAIAMIAMPTPPQNDPQLPPAFFKVFRIIGPLIYALPAVWGIVSAVGLLQLKNWARISTIVFSVLLMGFGALGLLTSMVFFLNPPPGNGVDPKMFSIIGAVTAVFALAQIGIGIWWMVFFNRAGVKAQFLAQPFPFLQTGQGIASYATNMPSSATPPPPGLPSQTDPAALSTPPIVAPNRPARPLSVSIIAWYLLAICVFVPFNLILHAPAILFTAILTGWPAAIFILAFAGVSIYAGIALLQMKPAGRLVGIGYFIFGLLNLAVFYFAPGRHARLERFMDVQQSMFPWMRSTQANSPFQADMMPFIIIGAVFGVALCLVPIYFLAVAKPAFDKAARERMV